MIGLALRMMRTRLGGLVASFVALFLGAVVVMVMGGLLETGIPARPCRRSGWRAPR